MQLRATIVLSCLLAGCGPAREGNADTGTNTTDAAAGSDASSTCVTSIAGTVFAPNGTLPLYGVRVYVPAADPPPFTAGVTCGRCVPELPGGALASAVSDTSGWFRLDDVPDRTEVPVIVTTGKWRRRLTLSITPCEDNRFTDDTFRLPRTRSEGEMPHIAQVTGGCDGLACVLSKLGIDASEFGADPDGPQAVTFFNGVGGAPPAGALPAGDLWGSLEMLAKFDLVINACECAEHNENKTAPDRLRQYADLGGRVYGSHFQYTWTKNLVPAWHDTATWEEGPYPTSTADRVDTSHPGGAALASWLVAVGASTSYGEVSLGQRIPNATEVTPPTTRWLYTPGSPGTTHYLSFRTPVGAPPEQQCGKVVYAGLHVSSGSVTPSFPSGCATAFTADEKALAFLLFDLQACDPIVE